MKGTVYSNVLNTPPRPSPPHLVLDQVPRTCAAVIRACNVRVSTS